MLLFIKDVYLYHSNFQHANIAMNTSITPYSAMSPKVGKVAPVWSYFTDMDEPWKLKSASCKHCHVTVKYHRKNEYALVHLKSCAKFHAYCEQ